MGKMLYPLPHLTSKMPFPVHREMPAFPYASYLIFHQHGDVHKHVMELLDAALQPYDVLVPTLNLAEGLLGNLGVNDPRSEDGWVATLQHLFQLLICCLLASNFKLPLDAPFAAFTEVHLSLIVLCHHLHKLPGEDGVLGLSYPKVCR